MKRIARTIVAYLCCLCSLLTAAVCFPKAPQTEAVRFAQSLGSGWNLGNTLEAWQLPKPDDTETCWGNPKATKALFQLVSDAGFQTVRVPVTWFQHMNEAGTIDPAWLDRVQTVIDDVLSCGMYAVVNIQHDDQDWLIPDEAHEEKTTATLISVWTQIARRFRDYDERLLFDLMNEPRVVNTPDEWTGNPEARAVINRLNEAALAAIRQTGGNNESRYVMITTHSAKEDEDNIAALTVPDDRHVLVSLHYYYGTAHQSEFADCEEALTLRDKWEIYKAVWRVYRTFSRKGVGVCFSEFGWTDRDHLDNLAAKTKTFVKIANGFGIPCFVWDNGSHFRLLDRDTLTVAFPGYTAAAARQFERPTVEDYLQ